MNSTSHQEAPWIDERDDRHDGVVLVWHDGEDKQTVRRFEGGGWYVVDWELTDYNGQHVWFDRCGFTISQDVLNAIARLPEGGRSE